MHKVLRKQELMLIAMELDAPDLLNFCKSDTFVGEKVCTDPVLWRHKLKVQYPHLDISNVATENLRALYEYLNERARVFPTSEKTGYGVLNLHKNRYSMLGYGGEQKILTDWDGNYNNRSLLDLKISFPEYSPEYLMQIFKPGTTVAFKISKDKTMEFVNNYNHETQTSYITGKFGEIYPAHFSTNSMEQYTPDLAKYALKYLKSHPRDEQTFFSKGQIHY